MRFLVIQLRQLGDIILSTPALSALRKSYPNSEIIILTHKMGKLVLLGNPDITEHWIYEDGISGFLSLIRKIRKRKFDVCFDFLCNPRSAYFAFFSGAKKKVGFKGGRSFAYDCILPRQFSEFDPYLTRQKIGMIEKAGYKILESDPRPRLYISSDDTHLVDNFCRSHPAWGAAQVRCVISPTHRRPARLWSGSNFAQVADFISLRLGAAILWLWGPGERDYVQELQNKCESGKGLLLPQTSFLQMSAFIAASDFMLSGSNGPSHAGVAFNICTLQLHGPTSPRSWSPSNEKHHTLSPRSKEGTQTSDNISDITVSEVIEKITSIWPLILAQAEQRKQK